MMEEAQFCVDQNDAMFVASSDNVLVSNRSQWSGNVADSALCDECMVFKSS